jgi:hypothetical protein
MARVVMRDERKPNYFGGAKWPLLGFSGAWIGRPERAALFLQSGI